MTISSASSVQQGGSQNSLGLDPVLGQEPQDDSPVEAQDYTPAPPSFQNQTSPQKDLQKLEQSKKPEPDTWDKFQQKADYAQGYVEGLIPLRELYNQVATKQGVPNHLIESPHYQAGYQSGKTDHKEGLTYASGFIDGVNPVTPVFDAVRETTHIERQHPGSESTYWKGRTHGSAVGVVGDTVTIAKGVKTMGGSVACQASSLGLCSFAAGPGFAIGAGQTALGVTSMVSHVGIYSEAQQQYMESRAREQASTTQSVKESTPSTDPNTFESVKNSSAKRNKQTGEIWKLDKLHNDHYEVYKNKKMFEKGHRDRVIYEDGRLKQKLK